MKDMSDVANPRVHVLCEKTTGTHKRRSKKTKGEGKRRHIVIAGLLGRLWKRKSVKR